ncbi:MAG TPA: hypothetical protein VLW55_16485 [Burkholderiaceae bacterium]|nr:hypothetical protein [Burkholderiaceae bacterium]
MWRLQVRLVGSRIAIDFEHSHAAGIVLAPQGRRLFGGEPKNAVFVEALLVAISRLIKKTFVATPYTSAMSLSSMMRWLRINRIRLAIASRCNAFRAWALHAHVPPLARAACSASKIGASPKRNKSRLAAPNARTENGTQEGTTNKSPRPTFQLRSPTLTLPSPSNGCFSSLVLRAVMLVTDLSMTPTVSADLI